jgi:hypothetical protein
MEMIDVQEDLAVGRTSLLGAYEAQGLVSVFNTLCSRG